MSGTMALRILSFTCLYPRPGNPGQGTFIRCRLQRLARRAEVKVVAPVALFGQATAQRQDGFVEVLHPRWFYVPGSGFVTAMLLALQALWTVRRLRRRFAFDVIDAHFGYPEGVAAWLMARLLNVPFTITFRGSEVVHAKYPARRWLMRRAVRGAARVIAVSERLRRFAVELGAGEADVRTIPNGIDTGLFHPRDRAGLRRSFGWRPDDRVLLTAGHLIELKGHQHAIAAVRRLHNEGIPVRLLIAGGSPARGVVSFEAQLRRLADQLHVNEHVEFLGHVPPEQLAGMMSAADVFCLPSSREGWPNVVHEAMACGAPVVATDVGAVPEMISDPAYGLVVPPQDSTAFTEAIRRALATEWDRAAIARWAERRSWDQVAREVDEELRAAIDGTRNAPGCLRPAASGG